MEFTLKGYSDSVKLRVRPTKASGWEFCSTLLLAFSLWSWTPKIKRNVQREGSIAFHFLGLLVTFVPGGGNG